MKGCVLMTNVPIASLSSFGENFMLEYGPRSHECGLCYNCFGFDAGIILANLLSVHDSKARF